MLGLWFVMMFVGLGMLIGVIWRHFRGPPVDENVQMKWGLIALVLFIFGGSCASEDCRDLRGRRPALCSVASCFMVAPDPHGEQEWHP